MDAQYAQQNHVEHRRAQGLGKGEAFLGIQRGVAVLLRGQCALGLGFFLSDAIHAHGLQSLVGGLEVQEAAGDHAGYPGDNGHDDIGRTPADGGVGQQAAHNGAEHGATDAGHGHADAHGGAGTHGKPVIHDDRYQNVASHG